MNADINLLQKQDTVLPQLARIKQVFDRIGIPMIASYAVVFLGVLGTSLFLESRLTSLDAEQASLRADIRNLRGREEQYVTLKRRLNGVSYALSNRYAHSDALDAVVQSLQTPGVSFESIKTSDDQLVTVKIDAADSNAVEQFVQQLQAQSGAAGWRNLTLSGATFEQNRNTFTLDVSFVVPAESVAQE